MLIGRVFDIQRFSIHDGPGIRTTVFLKGCPLRCEWCHNPEAISPRPSISFVPEKCIGCGYCFRVCPEQAHVLEGDQRRYDRSRCRRCGLCAEQCYSGALEKVGRDMAVQDVLDEVLRDRAFYERSGGGLTVSGGEPLAQLEFTAALLESAGREDLHTCLETCGYGPPAWIDRLAPLVDLFLFDYKETDAARHVESTGVPREPIVENLKRLDRAGARIVLRCPIVPGRNDRPDHFDGIAALARELPRVEAVEVLPYHALGQGKLERLGATEIEPLDVRAPADETVDSWRDALRGRGVKVLG